jgi:hypothetical protein
MLPKLDIQKSAPPILIQFVGGHWAVSFKGQQLATFAAETPYIDREAVMRMVIALSKNIATETGESKTAVAAPPAVVQLFQKNQLQPNIQVMKKLELKN